MVMSGVLFKAHVIGSLVFGGLKGGTKERFWKCVSASGGVMRFITRVTEPAQPHNHKAKSKKKCRYKV